MKKRSIILLLIASAFVLCACGKNVDDSISSESSAVVSKDATVSMIDSVLVNPIIVFEETLDEIIASNGANIGTDSDPREMTEEGIQFHAAEGENPFMPLAKALNEVDGIQDMNQAFLIRFKPSAKDFGFMLSATAQVGITIGDDAAPLVFVLDHDYMAPMEGNLKIEPDHWYQTLIAISSDGILAGIIWKDGEEGSSSSFSVDMNQFDDDSFKNQSWQVFIGFKGDATFTVSNYAYYTFSDLAAAN